MAGRDGLVRCSLFLRAKASGFAVIVPQESFAAANGLAAPVLSRMGR
jgi:hypothetical protein